VLTDELSSHLAERIQISLRRRPDRNLVHAEG
jgi:hypothetical protein